MKTMYFGIITDIEFKAIKAIAFDTNKERNAAWEAVRTLRHCGCASKVYIWMVNVIIDQQTLKVVRIDSLGVSMSVSMYMALNDTLDDLGIE